MSDRYPTDEELAKIEAWDGMDIHGLMEFVRSIWWPDGDYGFQRDGDTYVLATGGWSGNEETIGYLAGNFLFWSQCWRVHRTGGHYYFTIPKLLRKPPSERR